MYLSRLVSIRLRYFLEHDALTELCFSENNASVSVFMTLELSKWQFYFVCPRFARPCDGKEF